MTRILFQRYPRLRGRVPFEALVDLPTPVEEHRGVWVKRDDLAGGGELRKLEFFRPARDLLAWGPEGSDWLRALARRRKARFVTYPQRRTEHSRCNAPHIPGDHCRDPLTFGLRMLLELPRVVGGGTALAPPGGSDPVTTLGFVNAALELAGQAARGECPLPDAVFVPLATCGAAAGLALGFGLAGLDVAVHAVRVAAPVAARARNLFALATQCAWLLDERPRLCRVAVERDFYGGSGTVTPEGRAAREFFRPLDLDLCHDAKAAACLLARRPLFRTPLLWLASGTAGGGSAARIS